MFTFPPMPLPLSSAPAPTAKNIPRNRCIRRRLPACTTNLPPLHLPSRSSTASFAMSKPSALDEFTPAELRKLRSLRSPAGIQRFLDALPYHLAGTAWSPRKVLRERTAHCLEGAFFAAAALRANGFPPLVMDMEAQRDTDHVVAIF